jgi:hypothetical protein
MKIRLTEGQYSRLLTEDKDYGRLDSTITKYMIKMFEFLDDMHTKKGFADKLHDINTIKTYLDLNDHEANIVYHNYINKWENRKGDIVGEPLDFVATYTIKTIMPTVVSARTYLPGFVEVTASSSEDALDKVLNGEYNTMYLDENSLEFDKPDLDYDMYGDADIMEDMVFDHVGVVDWEDTEEIEDRIKIKK